jgi:type I restriction enzyme M protein
MDINDYQKQTNTNVQEKANLIWDIATKLYGEYKPHEYGRVILPMTVIKRFDDALKDTKADVVATAKQLDDRKVEGLAREAILKQVAKHDFYNTSKFDFPSLLSDSDNVAANFTAYLQGFSDNVKDIIARFEFDKEIQKMSENDLLFVIITEFNSKKADMSPDHVTSQDMGYIFEELIRKFSESYDEQAGAHFTARDIIYLMTDLLIAPEREQIKTKGCAKTAYDMAMGTSQMLACLDERLAAVNPDASLKCFGQEFNPETFAIAKADMLIKGGDADNMKFGDTLSNDQFTDYQFDYIISNPPFGIDWKKEEASVETEAKLGFDGRFGPGLPAVSDGQMLFLLNGVKKLKDGGRMAIIQNGSSLFTGDAGSGPSNIRRYLIENDLLEAIIQLPKDLFYNTGIATYIWLVSKTKSKERLGKIQLIDASQCYSKRRKSIGNKRVDLSEKCIDLIIKAYSGFQVQTYKDANSEDGSEISVESKVFDNSFFGYAKTCVETAVHDNNGKIILKKGKKQAEKGLGDYEIIPFGEDKEAYFTKNVLPYNPYAFIDDSKSQIGYEIPFIRLFYKFVQPATANSIFEKMKQLEKEEKSLMTELFDHEK